MGGTPCHYWMVFLPILTRLARFPLGGKRTFFESALDTPANVASYKWLAFDAFGVALDQAPLSSHFSEVPFPEANSGCSGPFRFPAREQMVASRAMLASHFAFRGGAPDRVVWWGSRRDSYSA